LDILIPGFYLELPCKTVVAYEIEMLQHFKLIKKTCSWFVYEVSFLIMSLKYRKIKNYLKQPSKIRGEPYKKAINCRFAQIF
jgi:hypothetical protein